MMHRGALFVLMIAACGGPAAPPPAKAPDVTVVAAPPAAPVVESAPAEAPPRWVPSRAFQDIGEGRRGAILNGKRNVVDASDKLVVVDSGAVIDLGRTPRRIPSALGGGWIFPGARRVSYAKTFDGPLVTIAQDINDMTLGFANDRVFVQGTLYALSTGKPQPALVADTVQLFGLPTGQTAIRTKNGDIHFSPATGKPFTKVASGIERIAYDGSTFVLQGQAGERRLALDGKVTIPAASADAPRLVSTDNLMALDFPDVTKAPPQPPIPDQIVSPLSGVMADGTAIRVEDRDLLVYDGRRGVLSSTQKEAFAGHENCSVVRGGTPAFVGCNDHDGVSLFRIEAVDRPPELEKTFRDVFSQELGYPAPTALLALARKCDGTLAPGVFCVRQEDGAWTETPPVDDPQHLLASVPFVVNVVANKDGVPFAFGWQNGNGDLLVAGGRAKTVCSIKKGDLPAWAQIGLRWQSVTSRDGNVRFLVPGNQPGVVTIDPNGKVDTHALDGRLGAMGARGLLAGPNGKLTETLDAGQTWQDVAPPPGGTDATSLQCEETGCLVGAWLRLGWSR